MGSARLSVRSSYFGYLLSLQVVSWYPLLLTKVHGQAFIYTASLYFFNRHTCTHKSLLCDWLKVQIKFYYLFSILEECREYWLMTYRSQSDTNRRNQSDHNAGIRARLKLFLIIFGTVYYMHTIKCGLESWIGVLEWSVGVEF